MNETVLVERMRLAVEVLETIAGNRALLAHLPVDERTRLLKAERRQQTPPLVASLPNCILKRLIRQRSEWTGPFPFSPGRPVCQQHRNRHPRWWKKRLKLPPWVILRREPTWWCPRWVSHPCPCQEAQCRWGEPSQWLPCQELQLRQQRH